MSAPPEALKAQAVAARSFFVAAGRRHHGFQFCDTTHCQFLREPPAQIIRRPGRRARRPASCSRFAGAPIAAFYSASCGGRTRTLADAGLQAADGYPYFSVECAYCERRQADTAIATVMASGCVRREPPAWRPSTARRSRTSSSTTIPGPRWRCDGIGSALKARFRSARLRSPATAAGLAGLKTCATTIRPGSSLSSNLRSPAASIMTHAGIEPMDPRRHHRRVEHDVHRCDGRQRRATRAPDRSSCHDHRCPVGRSKPTPCSCGALILIGGSLGDQFAASACSSSA